MQQCTGATRPGEQGAGQGDGAADGALVGQGLCLAGEILRLVSEARRPADRPLWWIPGSSGGPVRRIPLIVVALPLYLP